MAIKGCSAVVVESTMHFYIFKNGLLWGRFRLGL